jgi:hypothetical protein
MTIEPTSSAAYAEYLASGNDTHQGKIICNLLRKHGPMPDFDLIRLFTDMLPETLASSVRARRRTLTQEVVVGIMPHRVANPKTGKETEVWGLIKEHGASRYFPLDCISIRVLGESITVEFDDDDIQHIVPAYLGKFVKDAIDQLVQKVRDADARR